MIVRKLQLQHGWSQEQLGQLSGLSTRTIQRIERGHKAGLESLKSLAAVFEIEMNDLIQEREVDSQTSLTYEEQKVIEKVQDIKAFYSHLVCYVVVIAGLFILNWLVSPNTVWAVWAALGWGIGVISHGLSVFEIFFFLAQSGKSAKLKNDSEENFSYTVFKPIA